MKPTNIAWQLPFTLGMFIHLFPPLCEKVCSKDDVSIPRLESAMCNKDSGYPCEVLTKSGGIHFANLIIKFTVSYAESRQTSVSRVNHIVCFLYTSSNTYFLQRNSQGTEDIDCKN